MSAVNDGQGLRYEPVGGPPIAELDGQSGSLAEGHRGGRKRSLTQAGFDGVDEHLIGRRYVTVQQPRDRVHGQRDPQEWALWAEPGTGVLSIGRHAGDATPAQHGFEERYPALERAAVWQDSLNRAGGGGVCPPFSAGAAALRRLYERGQHGEVWDLVDDSPVFEPAQPAKRAVDVSRSGGELGRTSEEAARPLHVTGGLSVLDGQSCAVVRLEPCRGAIVEPADEVGFFAIQLGSQEAAEKRVVAIPVPVLVEGYDEQVRRRERLEHLLCPGSSHDGVAQGPAQFIEHRRSGQEHDGLPWEVNEELGTQVVRDEPVIPVEWTAFAAGSPPALNESAARYRPAGQPSVSSSSS